MTDMMGEAEEALPKWGDDLQQRSKSADLDAVPNDSFMTDVRNTLHSNYVLGDPRLDYLCFYDKLIKRLYAIVRFRNNASGPPGHAHGGAISAVIDDSFGMLVYCSGRRAVTGTLTVYFRKPLPLMKYVQLEGNIVGIVGKKVNVESRIIDPVNGIVFAEGSAVFIQTKASSALKSDQRAKL